MPRGAKIAAAGTMLIAAIVVATVFRKPAAAPRIEAVEATPLPLREASPAHASTTTAPPVAPSGPSVEQMVARPALVVAPVFPKVTLEWPLELGPEATLGAPRELPPEEVTSHQVRDGETLSSLARKYLGSADRFRELLEANRDVVPSPEKLRAGVVLRIPRGGINAPRPSDAVPMVPIDKGDWRKAPPGPRGL